MPTRVIATAAARQAIRRLRGSRGPVMFVQSAGCCAGSAPMCFADGEYLVGDNDVMLGRIDACPVYIDRRLDDAWGNGTFVLDVADGEPEGFSLAAGPGLRFVTRAQFDQNSSATTGKEAHDEPGEE